MPPLVKRLVRRHRLASGCVVLGMVDERGYVQDTSATTVGSLFTDGSAAQIALVLHDLAATLDLRRRDVRRLGVVICRTGPLLWLPADLRGRTAIEDEARTRSLRLGAVFLIGETGWREDNGDTGSNPGICAQASSPWERQPSPDSAVSERPERD
jgi:hypothetical protein